MMFLLSLENSSSTPKKCNFHSSGIVIMFFIRKIKYSFYISVFFIQILGGFIFLFVNFNELDL